MSRRASSHAVAVALLLAVAVVVAGGLWLAVAGVAPRDPPPRAALSLSVTAADDRVALRHRGGAALDVRALRLRVTVDGTPLDHQPPVPFFAATGFESGPTGPFNVASDHRWTVGERATFAVADTNAPTIGPGATVRVAVYAEGGLVVRLSATADRGSAPSHDRETVGRLPLVERGNGVSRLVPGAVPLPADPRTRFTLVPAPAPPSRWLADCRGRPAWSGARSRRSRPPRTSGQPRSRRRTA